LVSGDVLTRGDGGRTWETRDLVTVNLVSDSYLDFLKAVKHIKLGQVQFGVAVDHGRVFHDDQVQPSTSPSSSGSGTPFSTDLLQGSSDLFKVFCREGSTSDSSSVGFDDTDDSLQGEGGDTETGHDTSDGSRGGSDIGVGSVVEVEHESIGTLDKDPLARLESLVHVGRSIDNVRSESLSESLFVS